jgi:hypothetical protein
MLTTAEVDPELFNWLTTDFVKRRASMNIPARVIVASDNWHQEYTGRNADEVRNTVTVPSDQFPFQHEAMVYGDKFALVNYKKGEKLIGIVINHPQIAKTMRAWFELAWKGAVSLDK